MDNQSPGNGKGSQFDSRTYIDISFQNGNALWRANSTLSTSAADSGKDDYISTEPSRKPPALYFGFLSWSSQSLATCMGDMTPLITAICCWQLGVLPIVHLKNRKLQQTQFPFPGKLWAWRHTVFFSPCFYNYQSLKQNFSYITPPRLPPAVLQASSMFITWYFDFLIREALTGQ